MTEEQFAALPWPEQIKELDRLTELSCKQSGKSWGEAQKKRRPIDKLRERFQRIHDEQVQTWVKS